MIPNYTLFREVVGVLFLLDFLFYLPWAHVCLGPGYWGGRWLARPGARALVYAAWPAAALALVSGTWVLASSFVLWLIFRFVYIEGRWTTLFRGGGAPGFMSHYAAGAILLFEIARVLDPGGALLRHALLVVQIDFGVVLLCSGTYKALSGYLAGEGMEYGLANPLWGYWAPLFRRVSPGNLLLRLQDVGAAVFQILMGIFLIVPPTRPLGALMCAGTFFYLLFTVRLGRLAALMMALPLIYLPELGISLTGGGTGFEIPPAGAPDALLVALHAAGWIYLGLLPVVKGMQYANLFGGVKLPEPLQTWLTRYANLVPIIMWRVFTPDVTNFFVRIAEVDRTTGELRPIADEHTAWCYTQRGRLREKLRFLHVTESIAITTVFTSLKYFRSDRALFERKLVEYARSLGRPGARIRFEYVAIVKREREFEYRPVIELTVDLADGTIVEHVLDAAFDPSAPAAYSHIRETTGYGSYVPRGRP